MADLPDARPRGNAARAPRQPPPRPLEVTYRPLADLVPYAQNARRHSPAQVDKIKASLLEFGWANVMAVAGNQMIVGHARLAAALALLAEDKPIPGAADPALGPTIDLSHLSPAQQRAYVLADNRLAEDATWDLPLLRGEFSGLQMEGFNLGLAGFTGGEVTTILSGWTPDFARHDGTDATLDPLVGYLRVLYLRADHDAVLAALKAAIAPFARAEVVIPK